MVVAVSIYKGQDDLFNPKEGERLRQQGMERAAAAKPTLLQTAQGLAQEYAQERGKVSADDVALLLRAKELPQLGCAAGSLFKGKQWYWNGETMLSARPRNHRHILRVWRLK